MIAQPALDADHAPEVLPGVVGWSEELKAAAQPIAGIARSDGTCLLTGEAGTGKELFARAIHHLSARKHRQFVPVNCGAISDACGVIANAGGGTLLLDDVDALSAGAQVELLQLFQEQEHRPAETIRMNVRVLAATNKDLSEYVQSRRFHKDLFCRINTLRLQVPALRDHPADIPVLAQHFTRDYAARHRRAARALDQSAMDRLVAYAWPGNVRELQEVLQRAVLFSANTRLTAADLDLPDGARQAALTLRAAKDRAIAQFERKYLSEVLHRCQGNISRAAQVAGKERRTFQRLLRKYRLEGAAFRPCQS